MTEQLKKLSEEIKSKIVKFLESAEAKEFIEKIKSAEDSGTFEGLVISTEHQDRQGEILMQDGMDSSLYMKNPVVINSHNYWGIENIIGLTTRLYPGEVDGVKATLADGKWAPTEEGQIARKLWDERFLNAASVGLIPKEFDVNRPNVITQWELLEYSPCPVPANGHAARMKLKELGFTVDVLRKKGFEIETEAKADPKEGDPCTMDDGTEGTMQMDGDGNMVCMPMKKAQEGTEEKPKTESEEAKEICSIEVTRTNNVITLVYTDGSKSAPMKMTEDFETELEKIFFKAGRVLSDKNRALIQNCVDNMKNSIVALEELLTATESSEGKSADNPKGNEGEEQPEENPDAPKERSKDGGFDEVSKALDVFLVNRQVLRSAVNALSGSLESLNKKIKENRKK